MVNYSVSPSLCSVTFFGMGSMTALAFNFHAEESDQLGALGEEKQTQMQNPPKLASPFNAVYRHSMQGNTV